MGQINLLMLRFAAVVLVFVASALADGPVDLEWGVKIPMRDGVDLNATVIGRTNRRTRCRSSSPSLPISATAITIARSTSPAMVTSSHWSTSAGAAIRKAASSRWPMRPDGHDVVEWPAKQPWSNGKVTMWGGSYAGFDQWSTLKEFPPHLATIVPAAAAHPAVDFPFFQNVFHGLRSAVDDFTSGSHRQSRTFGNSDFWKRNSRELT